MFLKYSGGGKFGRGQLNAIHITAGFEDQNIMLSIQAAERDGEILTNDMSMLLLIQT